MATAKGVCARPAGGVVDTVEENAAANCRHNVLTPCFLDTVGTSIDIKQAGCCRRSSAAVSSAAVNEHRRRAALVASCAISQKESTSLLDFRHVPVDNAGLRFNFRLAGNEASTISPASSALAILLSSMASTCRENVRRCLTVAERIRRDTVQACPPANG